MTLSNILNVSSPRLTKYFQGVEKRLQQILFLNH
jgi:hypothetical protein